MSLQHLKLNGWSFLHFQHTRHINVNTIIGRTSCLVFTSYGLARSATVWSVSTPFIGGLSICTSPAGKGEVDPQLGWSWPSSLGWGLHFLMRWSKRKRVIWSEGLSKVSYQNNTLQVVAGGCRWWASNLGSIDRRSKLVTDCSIHSHIDHSETCNVVALFRFIPYQTAWAIPLSHNPLPTELSHSTVANAISHHSIALYTLTYPAAL